VAILMYRYIFVLLDEAADMAEAQRVRLGWSKFSCALSSVGMLAGTVLVRSLDQATRTQEAMTLRGYNGSTPFAPLPPLARRDRLLLAALPLTVAALFCAMEFGGVGVIVAQAAAHALAGGTL
jgi:cobalt/nickel transport system permease protein